MQLTNSVLSETSPRTFVSRKGFAGLVMMLAMTVSLVLLIEMNTIMTKPKDNIMFLTLAMTMTMSTVMLAMMAIVVMFMG